MFLKPLIDYFITELRRRKFTLHFSVALLINKIRVLHSLYVHAGQLLTHVKFLS